MAGSKSSAFLCPATGSLTTRLPAADRPQEAGRSRQNSVLNLPLRQQY
jgi:hypothetical protein